MLVDVASALAYLQDLAWETIDAAADLTDPEAFDARLAALAARLQVAEGLPPEVARRKAQTLSHLLAQDLRETVFRLAATPQTRHLIRLLLQTGPQPQAGMALPAFSEISTAACDAALARACSHFPATILRAAITGLYRRELEQYFRALDGFAAAANCAEARTRGPLPQPFPPKGAVVPSQRLESVIFA